MSPVLRSQGSTRERGRLSERLRGLEHQVASLAWLDWLGFLDFLACFGLAGLISAGFGVDFGWIWLGFGWIWFDLQWILHFRLLLLWILTYLLALIALMAL